MKKKLKEIQKDNSINKEIHKVNDINKYNLIKNTNQNYRKIKLISKNDLPELKLSKLKSRHESDSFNFKNINNSNASNNNITNASDIQNKKIMILNISKNNPVANRNDLIFPKIINPIKNRFYRQDKNSNDSSNSIENQNSNSKNRSINNNMRNNGHIILSKMQNKRKKEIIKKNLSEIHRIQKHKIFLFLPTIRNLINKIIK